MIPKAEVVHAPYDMILDAIFVSFQVMHIIVDFLFYPVLPKVNRDPPVSDQIIVCDVEAIVQHTYYKLRC